MVSWVWLLLRRFDLPIGMGRRQAMLVEISLATMQYPKRMVLANVESWVHVFCAEYL